MPLNQNDVDRSQNAIKYLQAYRTDEERARQQQEQRQIENQRADRSETRAGAEFELRRQGYEDANTRAEQARKDAQDRFNATREDTKGYRNEQLALAKEKAKAQADYYSAQLLSKDAETRVRAEQEILKGAQDLVNKLEEGVKAGTYDPNVANNLVKMGYEMASPEQKAILDRDPRYKAAVGGVPLFKGPERKEAPISPDEFRTITTKDGNTTTVRKELIGVPGMSPAYAQRTRGGRRDPFAGNQEAPAQAPASPAPAAQTPSISMPKPGEVRSGYKYIGGDPADPQSWQKVQ